MCVGFLFQVSALVVLYTHLGDMDAAVGVLDNAVEYAQQHKVSFCVFSRTLTATFFEYCILKRLNNRPR